MNYQECIHDRLTYLPLSAFLLSVLALSSIGSAQTPEMTEKVVAIFSKNCGECHQDSDDGGINYITNLGQLLKKQKIVPHDLEKSRVWVRMNLASDPMPPEGHEPRPSPEDIEIIKQWITTANSSADLTTTSPPTPKKEPPKARQPVSNSQVVHAMYAWLKEIPDEDRRFKRFFVLNHLHNLPSREVNASIGMSNDDLDFVRAAASKAVNSLTWAPTITLPRIVDADRTILAIDLRDFEWDSNRRMGRPNLWDVLVQEYPYGLKHDQYPDSEATQRAAREIYQMTGSDIPWIRADWFVAVGLQPQNYHALLYDSVLPDVRTASPKDGIHADNKPRIEQPMNASHLFDWLKVDVVGNVRRQRAIRAGFTRSGVSSQPRLLERHPALFGSIWTSYDFKPGSSTMNLLVHPLGPDGFFDPARFGRQSFQHDGGEYIFGLPNGLHAYLLSNANGERINFGPSDVVEDRNRILGNSVIINGVSCIACHKQGVITDFRDEVRFGVDGLPSDARRIVRGLYLDRPELDEQIERDQTRYRAAVIETVLPFLPEKDRQAILAGADLIEPIAPVVKRFLRDTIGLDLMAYELGVEPNQLKSAIEHNDNLQRLGLAAVANGGSLNREIWESGQGLSNYQRVGQALRLGTPTSVQAPPWRGQH